MSGTAVKAQSPLYTGPQQSQATDTGHLQKKWFITKYTGITTGFAAFKGGSTSFLSAPLAMQLNRQITNNIFAFGGLSVAPTLLQYNGGFYQPAANKNYGLMRTNPNFEINPAARVGVMYINNDRTFSISGSVGVSRSSYNGYAPMYDPTFSHGQFMPTRW
ncbi:hypothetical protein F0L74_09395 [Chitinophaga agrisoli]|uniref:Uncharacterized protein n=1 Tax=Chitinophaga agrisoli TaxID=2607653 RepID=A0A5B2VU26_9BACT|nr:hypothetical protein [Chitinophaga agrisoli]KAA2242731.1 hypothetical protein F0L74_09395 [Chitinophaga agrisoli]